MSQHDQHDLPDDDHTPHAPHDPHPDQSAPPYTARLRPRDPLAPYILGGTINLLVGSHQSGKTTMMGHLLRSWHAGRVFDVPTTLDEGAPSPQLHGFLSTARSWQQLVAQNAAFHDLPPTVRAYCISDDAAHDLTQLRKRVPRIAIFEACLDKLALPRGGVVWVDPFMLFLGGNLLDFDACAISCLEIRKVLAARGLTLIGTGITAKPKSAEHEIYPRLLDRIIGTVSQLSYTDTAMYLATPDELNRAGVYTLQVHAQNRRQINFDYVRAADGQFVVAPPDAEFAPILGAFPPDTSEVSMAALRRALVPDVVSKPTLYRALKELIEAGRIRRVRYGYYARAPVM